MLWNLLSKIFIIMVFTAISTHSKRVSSRLDTEKVVICYVGTWAAYRPSEGQFQFGIGDLDPSQCTHLIYSFAGLSNETWSIKSLDPYLDLKENYGRDGYRNMTSLRQRYNGLKVTLAIGGWNEGSEKYSAFADNDLYRSRFINSVVKFLKEYGFDGLDLDWEFPGKRGGHPEKDKDNFSLLVKELSRELKKKGMLLTTAISADKKTIDVAYNISEISKYLDYIHVMAYDYHGAWDEKVFPNAPLHCSDNLCVEETVNHLLQRGASADKLVLGLPLYGRTFILSSVPSNQSQNPIGLAALKTGFEGPFTKEKGFMGYNEICKELIDKSKHWTSGWDENSETPYAIRGDRVIVYDNPKSIISKEQYTNSSQQSIPIKGIRPDDSVNAATNVNTTADMSQQETSIESDMSTNKLQDDEDEDNGDLDIDTTAEEYDKKMLDIQKEEEKILYGDTADDCCNSDKGWITYGLEEEPNLGQEPRIEGVQRELLYNGSRITRSESEILILSYIERFGGTDVALESLLELINLHLPHSVLSSKHIFLRDYRYAVDMRRVYLCPRCEDILHFKTNTSSECGNCTLPNNCRRIFNHVDLVREQKYFVRSSLREQLERLFISDVYFQLHDILDSNSDVVNGSVYRSLVNRNIIQRHDITLQLNTDGVQVSKSSKLSLWPIFVFINELPYKVRSENVLLCGLWYGKTKPDMNIFLKDFVEELNELHTNGFECQTVEGLKYGHF